ncbi:DUF3617 family protein [uncultured Desulfuromonas sp.]|uniref:DUF3617 domain-containing protein n=1 Tax=uncultured Desulfuromonas sp. TaxID=181013 RepID=UPI002AAA6CAD|nr:DUF3617 family protein [uncultured Desulfuromonas sp.]
MLKKSFILTSCAFTLLLFNACSSSSDTPKVNLNEGRWQITAEVKMANLPFAMPPTTYTTCLTQQDLIPKQGMQQENNACEVTSQKVDGNTVSWTITCQSNQGATTSNGSITYAGDTFEGKIITDIPRAGQTEQLLSGKRLGDCQ